jgi:hypothetical protein
VFGHAEATDHQDRGDWPKTSDYPAQGLVRDEHLRVADVPQSWASMEGAAVVNIPDRMT